LIAVICAFVNDLVRRVLAFSAARAYDSSFPNISSARRGYEKPQEREIVMARISLKVNGKSRVVDADPTTPLLYVLRGELGLNGPKFGCGLSQCGCCTVIVDGNAVRSCSMAVSNAQNLNITTLEGLGSVANPHRLQKAFMDEQAAQCGYCMNGIIMNAKAMLDKNPHPTEADIRRALDGILCRCGSHLRVIRAIQRAAV
jgi:nicotinate dehydrogenase subunit A